MADRATGDLRVGSLKVHGSSDSASRDAAAEFSQALAGQLRHWGTARAANGSMIELTVERRSGETVGEAAARALAVRLVEVRRG